MKKNILVTGAHRSGTTWTGKIISKAKGTHYVFEPFNIGIKRKYSPLTYWFEFIDDDTSIEHQKKVANYINSFCTVFHINTIKGLMEVNSLKNLYYYLKDIMNCLFSERTILKDPIAIMSAEWIYKNYNIDIIVLIRHPAAFVASLKVKNWKFDFNQYKNQHGLMNKYLTNYKDVINEYSNNKKDGIDQGILLWNIIYDTIAYYQSKYGDKWYFVRHEDLSINPIAEFEKMFSKINLTLDADVENYIKKTTNDSNQAGLKRNSAKNIKTWKNRLSNDEIHRIKIGTKDVWKKFYTEDDW